MQVKSLEINGFKSFAKKVELEFSVPIVSIVGPNGSGKSNVAEAFRFVLGEQSMKSMRGKRGEDLIWNGSKSTPKMNRASVKLIFDNRNRVFSLDLDEISIERSVHRDGVNEYSINGSNVRLRDILELLAKANIGASGHHIISQGEADRILTASTKERRGMIEDALGLKVYQYKREESEKKLEKTSDNIKQVESLRKEIAPHIKFLEKQVEKIQKAEGLRDELFELYQEYLAHEEKYIHKTKEHLKDEREKPFQELQKIESRIEELRVLISESEKTSKGAEEVLSLEKKMHSATERATSLHASLSRVEGEISAQERALRRSESEVEDSSNKVIPLAELERLEEEIRFTSSNFRELNDVYTLREIIEKIFNLFKIFLNKQSNADRVSSVSDEIKEELRRLQAKREDLVLELEVAEKELASLREDYENLRQKREDENIRGRKAERELFEIMNTRNELTSELYKIDSKIDELSREESIFHEELKEAQSILGHEVLRFDSSEIILLGDRSEQEVRRKKLERMKVRLEEAGASGGEEIKKEYEETLSRDQYLAKEIEDLEKSADNLKVLIAELKEKLETEFAEGIQKINKTFNDFFGLMFGGGAASLSLVKEVRRGKRSEFDDLGDEEDVPEEGGKEEGLEVAVSLPHKRIKGLSMLSGGERALTSIALLFAISQVNPPPFIILDETDAALDEANSKKYGDMVENLAKHSQLIVITHNRETMSRAGILYGVTMGGDGFSKVLSVKFDEAVAVAK